MKALTIHTYVRLPLVLTFIFSLAGILAYLASTNAFGVNPILFNAVAIDLVVTLPFIYWLLIRKTKIPLTTIIPVSIAGYLLGKQVIPMEHQGYLEIAGNYVLPVIELGVILFLLYNIRSVRKSYLTYKIENEIPEALQKALEIIYPKRLSSFLSHELLFFYYAIFCWGKRVLKKDEYSYHKDSGARAIYGVLLFLIIVETGVFHILIYPYAPIVAWILSILSIYSGFIFLGLSRSISKLPIKMDATSLRIRYGLINVADISFSSISKISLVKSSQESEFKQLSPLGSMEEPNILIHLIRSETLHTIYGFIN